MTYIISNNIVDFDGVGISVYPNPVGDVFNISNASGVFISIYSIIRVCLHENYLTNDNHLIDIFKFDDGIFILKLTKPELQKTIEFSYLK